MCAVVRAHQFSCAFFGIVVHERRVAGDADGDDAGVDGRCKASGSKQSMPQRTKCTQRRPQQRHRMPSMCAVPLGPAHAVRAALWQGATSVVQSRGHALALSWKRLLPPLNRPSPTWIPLPAARAHSESSSSGSAAARMGALAQRRLASMPAAVRTRPHQQRARLRTQGTSWGRARSQPRCLSERAWAGASDRHALMRWYATLRWLLRRSARAVYTPVGAPARCCRLGCAPARR